MGRNVQKVALAYPGGLDASVILRRLIETYRCEVMAERADLGQGETLIPVREKAFRTGASRVHIVDLREAFVRDKLYKGTLRVASRRSPRSHDRMDFATVEADRVYQQKDAEGFIDLSALRLKIRALRARDR